jgi:hypothetical protein
MKKFIALGAAAAVAIALAGQQAVAQQAVGCTMSVSPSVIASGVPTPVTVTWSTTGADYNGIVAAFLGGSRPPSGSRTFVVSTPQRYELVALSNSTLVNGVGSDAFCVATVSTTSHTAP